jgi:hypothetical protein
MAVGIGESGGREVIKRILKRKDSYVNYKSLSSQGAKIAKFLLGIQWAA